MTNTIQLKDFKRTIVTIPHYIDDLMRRNTEFDNDILVGSYVTSEVIGYVRKETLTQGTKLWIYHI